MAKSRYRVNSNHSIAVSGGGMYGPGTEVALDVTKSAYDKRLVDEGVLVPLPSRKPRGGSATPDTMGNEVTDAEAKSGEDGGE